MKIALLGTRGIPARYGGFETFAEELSTRLAARGHDVTVYCRRPFGSARKADETYRGVTLRTLPTVMHKYLETPLHALISFLDLFRRRFDAVLLCNAANAPFAFLVRLRGLPLYINVDGIERKRGKWNSLGKLWYRLGEKCAVWFATKIVADAQVIADYYRKAHRCESAIIAYGASAVRREPGETLAKFKLTARKYILYVSRLEPENNALGVIEAYAGLTTDVPLVIVGDAPYADEYKAKLHAAANDKVIFTGFQFGAAYQELQSNCLCYVQATEVGGTHPALIEAMAYGNAIAANGTPENREVLGEAGLFYEVNDFAGLRSALAKLLGDVGERTRLGQLARARAAEHYSWDGITDSYEKLLSSKSR